MRKFTLNPILAKELRSRMRTWRSPLVISIYLGILACITLGVYWLKQKDIYYSGFGPDVGLQIYVILTVFQLLLVSFVTPAFTAGVISGEREKQTLDLLKCTRLSAFSIVTNKLAASISYVLLLIMASLPVFGIVYFFGGVFLSEIASVFVIYLVTAITFGSIGIFCSTIFKRTQVSMVVTYIVVFFFLVGTLAIAAFLIGIRNGSYHGGELYVPFIIYLNPLVALFSIFPVYGVNFFVANIIWGIFRYGSMPGMGVDTLAFWHYNFIFNGAIAIILLLSSILMIDPVGRFSSLKRRSKKKKQQQDTLRNTGMEA